ncbi:hypothetical protein NO135_22900, partial [Clostridioides difficile]|nr:hypothetical protein [Clostridioides difficile]
MCDIRRECCTQRGREATKWRRGGKRKTAAKAAARQREASAGVPVSRALLSSLSAVCVVFHT